MLAVQDSKADANYFADLAGMAKGGLTVQSSTGTMMESVSSGENLMGYNILGSYAEARAKTDPSLGISYPKIMCWYCRGSRLLPGIRTPECRQTVVRLCSVGKGAEILANQADIPSIRNDIEGKNDIDGMTKMLGKALKPIPVDETLLDYLPKKRLEFIKQWRTAAAK
jgi:iron(III) transport system substrate-binding protein